MRLQRTKQTWRERLIYSPQEVSRATSRKLYERCRQDEGLPTRCDNKGCAFYSSPLVWNGTALKPVFDHINGNRLDNRPANLRLLCPNCESQQATRSSGNRGRLIDFGEGKFTVLSTEVKGRRDSYIIPPSGRLVVAPKRPGLRRADAKKRRSPSQ